MIREIDIDEISDGLRYNKDSLVKIGCNDCKGCSDCCRGMGDSIILDPYDIYSLSAGTGMDFGTLMNGFITLNVVDGIIMPNIKMREDTEGCGFLREDGRCSIHEYRPGFCRLFPLGRIYENGSFTYFNQIHECNYPNKTKVKVKNWLGIPSLGEYEKYINAWHDFIKNMQEKIKNNSNDEYIKNLNMMILNKFYVLPYDKSVSFYEQFYYRMEICMQE